MLGLGLADRRRDFAILTVLGARRRTLAAFVWAEGAFVLVLGTALGAVLGFGVAEILIKVLEGVFDPPPEQMSVPWGYVGFALAVILVATAIAIANGVRQAAAAPLNRLREQ